MKATKQTSRIVVAVAAVVLLTSACSGSNDDLAATATTTAAISAVDNDTAATILGNLEAMRTAYDFDTRIETDGALLTRIIGRNINGDSRFTTTTSTGATIGIISVGGTIWTSQDGGATWTLQAEQDLSSDPIGPLLQPGAISSSGEQLTATYPGSILGLPDDEIEVSLRFDAAAVELVHETNDITVRTRLSPAIDTTPILAPTTG